jgi:flagellar basal body rod protein FlgB
LEAILEKLTLALPDSALPSNGELRTAVRPKIEYEKSPSLSFSSKFATAQSQYLSPQTSISNHAVNAGATIPISAGAVSIDGKISKINERALSLHEHRLKVLASNIANADTPNYKAVDINVREALLLGQTVEAKNIPLKFYMPTQASIDGNTVETDAESAKFTDSAIRYEYAMEKVKGYYQGMQDLLKNTPY